MLDDIVHILPLEIKKIIGKLPSKMKENIEEIRIRENRPLEVTLLGGFYYVSEAGVHSKDSRVAYQPTAEQCRKLLEKITNYSLYTMEEELRRGYITVAGGHRIGIVGRTILDGGVVRGIRDIGGFNIRIARQIIGSAKPLLPKLYHPIRGTLQSILIISPPQQGKTTMLRDLARLLSYGDEGKRLPMKVGIVDERSEIAACVRGIPTFDVGPRTDVMDACPKAEGMMMLLRSMSPEVIIVDEIGRAEDATAIREAAHSGVRVIATAHAYDVQEVAGRQEIMKLIEENVFSSIIELRRGEKGFMHRVVSMERIREELKFETASQPNASRLWVDA